MIHDILAIAPTSYSNRMNNKVPQAMPEGLLECS